MNVREGTRRLGILFGVSGGILGGFFAYGDAQALWNARTAHQKFESLMALPTMQKVAKAVKEHKGDFAGRIDYKALSTIPPGFVLESSPGKTGSLVISVNLDGIKEVTVNEAGEVNLIRLATEALVQRTEPPALEPYLGLLLYPIVGFILPWGAIRALTIIAPRCAAQLGTLVFRKRLSRKEKETRFIEKFTELQRRWRNPIGPSVWQHHFDLDDDWDFVRKWTDAELETELSGTVSQLRFEKGISAIMTILKAIVVVFVVSGVAGLLLFGIKQLLTAI